MERRVLRYRIVIADAGDATMFDALDGSLFSGA